MRADDWIVLRVMPGAEKDAVEFLAAHVDGATTYYPVAKCQRIVRHAQVVIERAAFAGYVYARFQQYPNWMMLETYCKASPRLIPKLDSNGERGFLWMRNSIVEDLREREACCAFDEHVQNPVTEALVGTLVRIPSGPFIGYNAKVYSIVDGIVKLRVWILGKRSFLSFRFDDLFTANGGML